MKTMMTITIALLVTISSASFAASINERQQKQRDRIANGIQSGELTRVEAKKLTKQQHKIAAKEARFKSDGVLTRKERSKLQHNLNKASKNIYRKKHNKASRD